MKKIFFSLALLFLAFTALQAQITFIPKIGISIADQNVDGDGADADLDSRTGLVVGAGLEIGLQKSFAFQPELLYIQKGFEINGDNKARINYLEIPLLLKFKGNLQSVNLYGNIGPSLSFALGGEGEVLGEDFDLDFGDDDEDDYKSVDLGLQLGGGVGFEVGSGQLIIDLRYGLGLTDVDNFDDNDTKTKNRAFQITFGYGIPIGK